MSNDFDPLQPNPYASTQEPGVSSSGNREAALARVKTPAILLLVTGILSILGAIVSAVYPMVIPAILDQALSDPNLPEESRMQIEAQKQMMESIGFVYYGSGFFGLIGSIVMCLGASSMMKLKSYGLSLTACIVAICPVVSPCCGCVFPIAFGIWGIVVISAQDVKPFFD